MKKIVKQLSTIAITLFCFTSCSKEDLQPSAGNADKKSIVKENQPNLRSEGTLHTNMDFFQNSVAAVSYNTFPLLNVWTASSTTTESNSCASFQSGLKAKVISIVDNKITIQIQKANGASFGNTGTGYVKAISTCGNIAGNSTIQSNYTYVNIDFWATFTAGSVNFSPSITLSNGVRMYAPLITVSAKSDVAFEKYLVNGTNYNHFCQLNSTYLPSISCIPTSYMMLKKIV